MNLSKGKLAREITAQFKVLPSLGHHIRCRTDRLKRCAEVLRVERTPMVLWQGFGQSVVARTAGSGRYVGYRRSTAMPAARPETDDAEGEQTRDDQNP